MLLNDSQLQKIDDLIENFEEVRNYDSAWNNLAAYLIYCLKIEHSKNNFLNSLFTENTPFTVKKFIALCLLRIYNLNPTAISYNRSINLSIFKYFDYTLTEIYKDCGLKANSQTHEKQSQLSDYILNMDRELSINLNITSLKEMDTFEYKYKKQLLDKKYFDFFNFFLAGLNNSSVLNRIIKNVQNYITSTSLNKLNAYESCIRDLNNILYRAEELNTKYAKLCIEIPFRAIKNLIDEDLKNCPISKPAHLSIKLTGKKYHFLTIGEKFSINLEIINTGEGFAYDARLKVIDYNSEIIIKNTEIDLGTIDTEMTIRKLECEVIKQEQLACIELAVSWTDFDGNINNKRFDFEIGSQKGDNNWEQLKLNQPYSLKPVENEDELIGRTEKLNELIALCRNSNSCFITGQKRVGKTSLVKILKEKIKKDPSLNTLAVYVSLQLQPTVIDTIDDLVIKICKELKSSNKKLKNLEFPETKHSLGSIYDFLIEAREILENHNITIIIDEFDQLPLELYRRGDIGDSLFNAFKNLSTESKISFILVGGERLSFIKNVQAINLNLFKSYSLDYFDSEHSWNDFEELVKHPVKNDLEIDANAIHYLYSYTLGHPYFTKKICQDLYTYCVNNHDRHVTTEEMKIAIKKAVSTSEVSDFAHFWDDCIREKGDKEEEISIIRKKVFLLILEINNSDNWRTNYNNKLEAYNITPSDYESIVNELIVRQIVQKSHEKIIFRVKFFYEWLKETGSAKIFTTAADEKSIIERKRKESLAFVTSEEIVALTKSWGPYNGKEITSDKVRCWLNQFDLNPIVTRLMFKILQNILFYDNNLIRISCRDIYKSIIRKLTQEKFERVMESSKRKRDDIIVSYLESSFTKSGSEYAKIFADENSIYAGYAIPINKLINYLNSEQNVKALVFIDDFAGTGDSVCKNLEFIHKNVGETIRNANVLVFLCIICGFDKAKSKIENFVRPFSYKVEVIFSKILDEEDRCFSDNSKVFPLVVERSHAKAVCLEMGDQLSPKNPLGYGDCQSLVAFPNACPNNTLPILWQETDMWMPLFKRN